MSVYGNVRRIGSQSFQFDRIYPTRTAMAEAMRGGSDGVHVGRFVLIEYGQRYRVLLGETITRQEFDPESGELQDKVYPKWEETEEFQLRRQTDYENFGAGYDSTVWQKIYSDGYEQYIMVAELNAVLPKLDIDVEGGMIYSQATEGETPDEVYDAFNNKVEDIKVHLNKPYFDQYQDTEMAYLLHYPMPIQLNVDSQSIDFNEDGFNIFYGTQKDPSESYIHWLTDDFYGDNYDAYGNITSVESNIAYPRTNLSALLNSKTLRMHMPVFGNTVSDLYDLLYGHPAYERDSNGQVIIQPNGLPQIAYYRTPGNYFMDVHGHILRTNKDLWPDTTFSSTEFIIVNEIGNPIDEEGNEIPNYNQNNVLKCTGELILETLRPYFKPYRDKYPYIVDPATGVPIEIDGENILRTPLNDTDDGMYWTKFVPYISDILSNNSAGLAALLTELFGIRNPLTGEIKYWMLNDWTAEEYNPEGNTPTIRNKPEVVTYLTKTQYQNLDYLFDSHGENGKPFSSQRKRWLAGAQVTSDTEIPIYGANGLPVLDNNGYQEIGEIDYDENYQYYNVIKNKNGNVLEDGHWYVDINTWALRRISNLTINFVLNEFFYFYICGDSIGGC